MESADFWSNFTVVKSQFGLKRSGDDHYLLVLASSFH
jgi:hypothetical protein